MEEPTTSRETLRRAFDAGVAAAHPGAAVRPHLPPLPPGRLIVVGAGKATAVMADEVERAYPPDAALTGLVVTRHGQGRSGGRIAVAEAASRSPSGNSIQASSIRAEAGFPESRRCSQAV